MKTEYVVVADRTSTVLYSTDDYDGAVLFAALCRYSGAKVDIQTHTRITTMQNELTDWQREMLEALLAGKQLKKISPSGVYPVTKHEAMIRIAENLTSSLRIKREMYRMYSHVVFNKKRLPWTLERQRNDTHYMEFDAETHKLVKGPTPL